MEWTSQFEELTKQWADAQKKMTANWFALFSATAGKPTDTPTQDPTANLLATLLEQWRTWAEQSMNLFTPESTRTAEAAASQFFASQEHLLQLMRLVTAAWQSISEQAASSAEWQKVLQSYMEQLRQQLQALQAAGFDPEKLWQRYRQQMQNLDQPWVAPWLKMAEQWQTAGQAQAAPPWAELNNIGWQAFEQIFSPFLAAPSLGLHREWTERAKKSFSLWSDYQQALLAYQTLLGNAWINAFMALLQKLHTMAQHGQTFEHPRQFSTLWVAVADEHYLDLFHSEAYAKAQSTVINSGMALRRQLRELNETWLRSQDMPTRSDLDEAHRQIYELRKELKALKQAIKLTPAPKPAAKAAKAKTSTPKKRASRSQADNPTDNSGLMEGA
ncbi:MAG: hypothetical protein NT075_19950 [Chloroflexi bacterium]|nr:hypothetical protein [Chloroflexota bacterium]